MPVIQVPIRCPKCGGHVTANSYDVTLRILKPRQWYVCTKCNWEKQVDEWKREIFCQ